MKMQRASGVACGVACRAQGHRPSAGSARPAKAARLHASGGGAPGSQHGFAFITAIFVLVIMATFAAYAVTLSTSAQATTAVAVQGVRAHAAARAGLQWAAYTLRDPQFTAVPGNTPRDCFASPAALALPAEFAGFTVQVSCTRYPDFGATPNFSEEGTQRLAQYLVTATASSGTPGSLDYVERQLEARIEVCKDPSASSPAFACR